MVVIQWLLFFEVLLQARPVVLSPGTRKTTEDPIGLPLSSVVNGAIFFIHLNRLERKPGKYKIRAQT